MGTVDLPEEEDWDSEDEMKARLGVGGLEAGDGDGEHVEAVWDQEDDEDDERDFGGGDGIRRRHIDEGPTWDDLMHENVPT